MKGKKRILFLAALLISSMLAGCSVPVSGDAVSSGNPEETDQISLKLSAEEYPDVDGSTATIPFSEAVAAAVLGMSTEEARQYIVHNKTHEAYINLIEGRADLIFVTAPSEEELAYAEQNRVGLIVTPVVSEGFVFLTSRNNPVISLTLQQIREIYSGDITNWKELGGEDRRIIAYQRPPNSGSQTGMLDLVMGREALMEAPAETIIGEMGALIDAVAIYSNREDAIGYSYYYYVTDMWTNDKVKLMAVDGIYPDQKTISDGTYPICTAYYAVMRADEPEGSNVRRLLDWILSEQGQQTAEEAGYVKLGT